MKSLYRRYRPTKLSDVVGQPQVTEPLLKALEQNNISHAYIFIGPRGCGKTSVARILAHAVNGFDYEVEDDYVDIIEIDGASNRGIDNIRDLREKVSIAPTIGKYKVYIIDEVHMLTKEAFNALLKTLEEPPAHAIFIMATTDAYKVPITITSRAQTYTFNLVSQKTMTSHLKHICEMEKIDISDEALELVARRGGGSFRDSLSLLDQISSLSSGEITKKMVIDAMGLPQDETMQSLLEAYLSQDLKQTARELKAALSSGIKPETLAEEMISKIIEEPRPDLLPLLARLPEVRAPYAEAKMLVALTDVHGIMAATPNNTRPTTHATTPRSTLEKQPSNTNSEPTKGTFDWQSFTARVQELNDAVYLQLMKTEHELIAGTLHIYPRKRIIKTILSRDNNKKILLDALSGNVKITIHDENDTPSNIKKDKTLNDLSAIMGGEVVNDGGGSPF